MKGVGPAVLAALCCGWLAGCGKPVPPLTLELAGQALQAEVAATPEARGRGLAFRSGLAENQGMLFVYPRVSRQCMWMLDTGIPLSVAFLDDAGRIINVAEMAPDTSTLHCSEAPARYALEMNAGWFGKNGAASGAVLAGLERVPRPE